MGFFDDLFSDNTPIVFKLITSGNLDGLKHLGKIDIHQVYNGSPLIYHAVENAKFNKYSIVEYLVNAGCDVNDRQQQYGEETSLIRMGFSKSDEDVKVAKLLLKNGAKVNARGQSGFCALSGTIFTRKLPMLDLLREYDANFNITDWAGNTVFHKMVIQSKSPYFGKWPAIENEVEVYVQRLLKYEARPDLPNKAGQKPLDIPGYQFEGIERMKKIIRKYS